MNISDLVLDGRHKWYTINTLEKLCYFEETAEEAIETLYKLALSGWDNGNDAKLSFIALFQTNLSETTLNLMRRVKVLETIENTYGKSELIIEAYGRALKAHSFMGSFSSGNESYKNKRYFPEIEELIKYQTRVLDKLKAIILNHPEFSLKAEEVLYGRVQEQLEWRENEYIIETLREILKEKDEIPSKLRQILTLLNTEKFAFNLEFKNQIKELLELYKPISIPEELEAIVTSAPWITIRDKDTGTYINVSQNKAIGLAEKYIVEEKDWLPHLDKLLRGEQRQTFAFAEKIAQLTEEPIDITKAYISKFPEIEIQQANPIFIYGFLKGCSSDDTRRAIINLLIESDNIAYQSVRAIHFIKNLTYNDLIQVKDLVEREHKLLLDLEYLNIKTLSFEEVKTYVDWVKTIDHSFALQILWDFIKTPEEWSSSKTKVNELLWVDDILNFRTSINTSLHVEDLIKKSLKEDPLKKNIKFLIKKILKEYSEHYKYADGLEERLVYFLLQEYWETSWPMFGDFLKKNKGDFRLTSYLERINLDNQKLIYWAEKDDSNVAIAFRFIEVFDKDENNLPIWNLTAKDFILKYHWDNSVVERLSNKFVNYSIHSISAEILYQRRIELLKEILDPDNAFLNEKIDALIDHLEELKQREIIDRENYELE